MSVFTGIHVDTYCQEQGVERATLKRFEIPSEFTSIGIEAFAKCGSLETIIIPDNITKIMFAAFEGCSSLKSVSMPDSVIEIEADAFAGCITLTYVIMSRKIKEISNYTFFNCNSLRFIICPDKLIAIGREAFKGCKSLAWIAFPDGLRDVHADAFLDCGKLKRVICNNQELFSDSVAFISTEQYLNDDFQSLLVQASINARSISYRELCLITGLMQANYLTNWKTIAAIFKERSLDCISKILAYFGKDKYMVETKDKISCIINGNIRADLPSKEICNYLTPTDFAKLSTSSRDIVFRPPEKLDILPLCALQ